jgi:ribonuclease D
MSHKIPPKSNTLRRTVDALATVEGVHGTRGDHGEEELVPGDSAVTTPDTTPPIVPLEVPREGVPPVVTTPEALTEIVRAFAAGHGPVAVDAERASGHRYGQRAFLVQLRRAGAGTALVDPAALPNLSALGEAIANAEWVLHAASQDLPCLAEVGMRPRTLFDTELGSRMAGFARVGLAAVVEQLLGFGLAKEHSAVDWSVRPLPAPWLRYAALDVEVLIELRDVLAAELDRQGKLGWAREEFAALVAAPPPPPRMDPWRRTSGVHKVRTRRQLAVVRELWNARDALAREQDVSPGRLVPDTSIVEAALAQPTHPRGLLAVAGFTGRGSRRYATVWQAAIDRAMALPESQLPPQHRPAEGPPPARVWADRDPVAASRLARCRAAVTAIAEQHNLPTENLISPETVRRLAWEPPAETDLDTVMRVLRGYRARAWQIRLTSAALAEALRIPEHTSGAKAVESEGPVSLG